MQYSKKMAYAGHELGTLELVGHLKFDPSVLVLMVKFHNDDWDRDAAITAVEEVFRIPQKGYWTRLKLDDRECIRVEIVLDEPLRKPGHFTKQKARKLGQLLVDLTQQGVIYNNEIEHAASYYPGYVPGKASLQAFHEGKIDRLGRLI